MPDVNGTIDYNIESESVNSPPQDQYYTWGVTISRSDYGSLRLQAL